ncbi:unnamed protein product [Calypogeia fissa]
MKRLVFVESNEQVPTNKGKGGMRALVEEKVRTEKGKAKASSSSVDPRVYAFNLSRVASSELEEVEKKRLAATIREKTGWNTPVLVNPYAVQVGASWEAQVEAKRGEKSKEVQEGKKKVTFSEEPSSSQTPEVSSRQLVKEVAPKDPLIPSKGPGFVLERDVEREIEPDAIAHKFWKQEVRGFTNEELFGCMRKDVQEAILAKARKKRVYKEGPSTLV